MRRKTRLTQIKNLAGNNLKKSSDPENTSKEIWDFKTEIKDGVLTFGETLRSDVKKDLVDFTQDANQQLIDLYRRDQ